MKTIKKKYSAPKANKKRIKIIFNQWSRWLNSVDSGYLLAGCCEDGECMCHEP